MVQHGRVSLFASWALVAAVVVVTGVARVGPADAASAVVPGNYTITFVGGQGSIGSQPFTLGAACSNGIDDDSDGRTDYPADSGCASAADDDEDTPVTSYVAPFFNVSINAAGDITAPPSGAHWPEASFVSDGVAGHIDASTGALTLTWRFHLQISESGVIIQIGTPTSPIIMNLKSTNPGGAALDPVTRRATIVDNVIAFPGATCIGLFCGLVIDGKTPAQIVNEAMGIPTAPGDSIFNMVAEFDRSPISGTTPGSADLKLVKSHSGDFTKGVQGSYSLVVSNVGSAASSGSVTVADTLPAGLGFVSGSGSGWSCSAVAQVVTCSSSAVIAAGGSAPAVSLVVMPSVVGSVTNTAVVSGGGQSNTGNDSASDPTTVNGDEPPTGADLSLSKSHDHDFRVGRRGTYRLSVTNVGTDATAGEITVTDDLPRGMVYKGFSGDGWACTLAERVVTCTTAESVAADGSAPPLSITVKPWKAGKVTNTATVSGGGQTNTVNDTASDPTTVRRAFPICHWGHVWRWHDCGCSHWWFGHWLTRPDA